MNTFDDAIFVLNIVEGLIYTTPEWQFEDVLKHEIFMISPDLKHRKVS